MKPSLAVPVTFTIAGGCICEWHDANGVNDTATGPKGTRRICGSAPGVADCMHHAGAAGSTWPVGVSTPDDVSQVGTPFTVWPRMQRAICAESRMSNVMVSLISVALPLRFM